MVAVFVTGGTGFIGHHLLRLLLERGYTVYALTRRPQSWRPPGLTWIEGSLEDVAALRTGVRAGAGVIHLAGKIQARRTEEYFRVNTEGTRRLVEAMIAEGKPRRFVFISSLAAAGPAIDTPAVDETTPPRPVSPYGESKWQAEQIVHGLPEFIRWTILRPPAVYGPGDRATLPYFRIAARGWCVYLGNPERQFSLIYVRDLVEGILHVYAHPNTYRETYFIADVQPYSWRQVAETLTRICGVRRPRTVTIPPWTLWTAATFTETMARLFGRSAMLNRDKVREILQPRWVCRTEKLLQHTGFRPRYSLERGIRETIAWYRDHGWIRCPKSVATA